MSLGDGEFSTGAMGIFQPELTISASEGICAAGSLGSKAPTRKDGYLGSRSNRFKEAIGPPLACRGEPLEVP
jgi:hypothetical protein